MFKKIKQVVSENISKAREFFTTKSYTFNLSNALPGNPLKWDSSDFLKANKISLYLNKTISKRAEKIGQTQFVLKDKKGKKVENSPLLDLLNYPNKFHDGSEFWGLYQKYKDLVGEVFILKKTEAEIFSDKKVTELYLLPPCNVEPIYDTKTGEITKFKYNKGNGDTTEYKPEEIIYSFTPDPENPIRGISLVVAGARQIDTEGQINEYQSKLLKNGGKVEGIFKIKTPNLTKTQVEELKERYKEQYSGSKKAGTPLFMGGDMEYVNIGVSPTELAYLESKKTTLEDILLMTGVPKSLLGSFDDIKFDNADASLSIFLRETIKPLIENLVSTLNHDDLIPEGYVLDFVDPTPDDKDMKLREAESGVRNRYMTINEAREIVGLEPIEGGDELPKSGLDALFGGGDGQTVNNFFGFGKSAVKNENFNLLRTPEYRKERWNKKDAQLIKSEGRFYRTLEKYFNHQMERVTANIEAKKQFKKKGLIDDAFDKRVEVKIAKDTFLPIFEAMALEYGKDAMNFAGSEFDFHLSGTIASFLDKKADVFAKRINETTFEQLKSQFEESLASDETRVQLVDRIKDTYGQITDGRANVIARTEVHGTSQYATLEGYKQAGMTTKIWVAVKDDRTRDSHYELDGEEVPIDQPFSNGLMLPGDPNGSADEVINCRCQL